MWYKIAVKYNLFGMPISSGPSIKEFSIDEDVDEDSEIIEIEKPDNEMQQDENTEQITPEEFTPEDLQQNVEKIEIDPTAFIKLPPLHENCRCVIETIPYLSDVGINDGRRIWKRAEECCPICLKTSLEFNSAETQRLINKLNSLIDRA